MDNKKEKKVTSKADPEGVGVNAVVIPPCDYCGEAKRVHKSGIKYGAIGNVKYQRWNCEVCYSSYYQEIDFYTGKAV